MTTSPEIIDLVYEVLSTAPELTEIREWKKANSLLTLASTGGSIGIEKEVYDVYDRDMDEVTAYMNILVWVKNTDPVAGEAAVRDLAQAVRNILTQQHNLGGAADEGFVHEINYATADGGKSLLVHLAELDFRLKYYTERYADQDADNPIATSVNVSAESYE